MHLRLRLLKAILGDSYFKALIDFNQGNGKLYLCDPVTVALIIGSTIIAGATVGSAAYTASEEKKSQKKLLEFQEQQVQKAETQAANAEALAEQTAAEKVRKSRLAKTQSILTSPLGLDDAAPTQKATLLGGTV